MPPQALNPHGSLRACAAARRFFRQRRRQPAFIMACFAIEKLRILAASSATRARSPIRELGVGGVNHEMSRRIALIALGEQRVILGVPVAHMGGERQPERDRGRQALHPRGACLGKHLHRLIIGDERRGKAQRPAQLLLSLRAGMARP